VYDLPVTGVTRSLWHLRGLCAAALFDIRVENLHILGHSHSLCSARPPQSWGPSSNTNKGFHLELPNRNSETLIAHGRKRVVRGKTTRLNAAVRGV
jgi:hypothetical protein